MNAYYYFVILAFVFLILLFSVVFIYIWTKEKHVKDGADHSPKLITTFKLFDKLGSIFTNSAMLPDDWQVKIEEILLSADVGYMATDKIMKGLKKKVQKNTGLEKLLHILKIELLSVLDKASNCSKTVIKNTRRIILVLGVNGSGKTTTVAKLANYFKEKDNNVLLAACDTFRAGAILQLEILARKIGASLIKGSLRQDPSALLFDAIRSFNAKNAELLLVDTAGRLHTKKLLIEELKKMKRIVDRESSVEVGLYLVIDATQGQNALEQARIFVKELNVTGIILTKLDGTAKGGIVFAISSELCIPMLFVGVGEQMGDLIEFDPEKFTDNILGLNSM